ncbi:hypothetical protein KUCAC02_030061, partial [Chaenocephalus aceratus]
TEGLAKDRKKRKCQGVFRSSTRFVPGGQGGWDRKRRGAVASWLSRRLLIRGPVLVCSPWRLLGNQ